MDPWFTPRGAFFGSWFQFPENTPLLDQALAGVTDICVSHNHEDHFDPFVLLKAFDSTPELMLHIPQYSTKWFYNLAIFKLGGYAERIVEHPPYEPFQAGNGATIFFVPEESPGAIDSAIVAQIDGQSLINLNDSRLSSDQLLNIVRLTGGADLLALQASGASEYPISYTYPEEEIRARCVRKRHDKIDHCLQTIDLVQPDRVLFFAGPPVFLDQSLDRFNNRTDASIFPDQLDIAREVEAVRPDVIERTLFLMPGETFDDAYLWRKTKLDDSRLRPYTRKEEYVAAYRQRRADYLRFDWGETPSDADLVKHFHKMVTLSPYISACLDGSITFIVKGRAEEKVYTADFRRRRVRKGMAADPLYVLTAPAEFVTEVIKGTHTWDDIFLSLRMTFDERTTTFAAHFKSLLRFMDAELLSALESYELELRGDDEKGLEMMDVELDGATFRIQRLCPHAGADLERNGRLNEDGTITCLAHRFCFDVRSGDCLNAAGYRLKTATEDFNANVIEDEQAEAVAG